MDKKLLIAGIDPGTTAAYAIIDIDGKFIKAGSSKQLDASSIISELIKHGKVCVIGCDKQKVPEFVAKIATKLGSITINPEEDMKVQQKRDLARQYPINNDHERDSLASAIYAYNKVKPLMRSVNELVEKTGKHHLKNKLTEIILHDPEFNIKALIDVLETPNKPENIIMKKAIEEKSYDKDDFIKLFNRIKLLENDISLLKRQNNALNQAISQSERKSKLFLDILDKAKRDEKKDNKMNLLERNTQSLSSKLAAKENSIRLLEKDIDVLRSFIVESKDMLLLKCLDNLGNDEFNRKKKILKIVKSDILYVKDTTIISYTVLDIIKDKVTFIITENKQKSNHPVFKKYDIALIDASKLDLIKQDYFAAVDSDRLNDLIQKSDIIQVIVDNYRNKRDKEI